MKLSKVITEFVTLKQAMGMSFRSENKILKLFCRTLGDPHITRVSPKRVKMFLDGEGPLTEYWHSKYSSLKRLYHFAFGRGYTSSWPLPSVVPKRPEKFIPYLYSVEEFRRLLRAARALTNRKSRHLGETYYALLLTLYGTGLRISEAVSLSVADVDLPNNLLTVRGTKFYKTRLVPIGCQLAHELKVWMKTREGFPFPQGKDSAFFAIRKGHRMSASWAGLLFRRLVDQLGIHRHDGARYRPRLHDIRHTFVVNRVVSWYRESADVQRLLPYLSTYLGHIEIASTQRYLTMTPELLQEASRRFEKYALSEVYHA